MLLYAIVYALFSSGLTITFILCYILGYVKVQLMGSSSEQVDITFSMPYFPLDTPLQRAWVIKLNNISPDFCQWAKKQTQRKGNKSNISLVLTVFVRFTNLALTNWHIMNWLSWKKHCIELKDFYQFWVRYSLFPDCQHTWISMDNPGHAHSYLLLLHTWLQSNSLACMHCKVVDLTNICMVYR